jgi:Bacterial Ig domain
MLMTALLLATLAANVPDEVVIASTEDPVAAELAPEVEFSQTDSSPVDAQTSPELHTQRAEHPRSFAPNPARTVNATLTTTATIGRAAPVIDHEPPVVTIVSPPTASFSQTFGTAVTISGTASDDVGLANVRWQLTGSGSANGSFLTTGTWTHTFPSLAIGNYVFHVTATDTAGKPAVEKTRAITITRATTPPPPTPPPDDGKPDTSGDIHSQKCGAGGGLATMLLLCGVVGLRSGRRRIE